MHPGGEMADEQVLVGNDGADGEWHHNEQLKREQMSKELWIKAHEQAVDEAMERGLTWSQAYESDVVAARADEILQDRIASMIDYARERMKYEGMK